MKIARTIAASAVGASVILGGVALAGPAQAATTTQCHTTTKSFDLPSKPDVTVRAKICVKDTGTYGGYHHYKAWLSKVSWDGSWWNPGTRFNDFYFNVGAQHGSHGAWKSSGESNDVRSEINDNSSGSKSFSSGAGGYGVTYVTTKQRGWTADGYAVFDANDGRGARTWQLHGTAAVR
ncbi:hypothetical protein ABR737_01140 [Streptomyces sp. Edi2]|uniref:hypothetical protein n=1 Tax=Streptomyces sp. Edi2 TaxID=3162528 RepID=UPI003305C219